VCNGACAAGYADCNLNKLFDGCEINTAGDPNNCGACGTVCSSNNIPTPLCGNSVCDGVCAAGWMNCTGNKQPNGCETHTDVDPNNCGGCATVCSSNNMATRTCAGGVCNGTCNPGFLDCNNNKQTDGCEVNPNTDNNNCGGCGPTFACTGGMVCSGGVCRRDYTESPSPLAFVNACTTGVQVTGSPFTGPAGNLDDGATALQPMPISFSFYGSPVTQFWVNMDGAMGFGTPFGTYNYVCPLPNVTDPASSIMPFAHDLVQRSGVCVSVTGTAPNRQMLITNNNAYIFNDTSYSLTFTVVLSETSNLIDFLYQTMTSTVPANLPQAQGSTSIVGLQSSSTFAYQFSCNTASVPSGTALRFTP
jgi:hypothetical protein